MYSARGWNTKDRIGKSAGLLATYIYINVVGALSGLGKCYSDYIYVAQGKRDELSSWCSFFRI